MLVEDGGPLLVDAIRCHECVATFVAVADDLEQAVGTEFVDGEVAELVDAQDLGFDVVVRKLNPRNSKPDWQ